MLFLDTVTHIPNEEMDEFELQKKCLNWSRVSLSTYSCAACGSLYTRALKVRQLDTFTPFIHFPCVWHNSALAISKVTSQNTSQSPTSQGLRILRNNSGIWNSRIKYELLRSEEKCDITESNILKLKRLILCLSLDRDAGRFGCNSSTFLNENKIKVWQLIWRRFWAPNIS